MKLCVVLIGLLAAMSISTLPTAEAATPKALKTFSGGLDPGEITAPPMNWELNRNVTDFLFHYAITGGSEPDDVVYVSIDETGDHWDFLMGEGWAYCDCSLNAGSYSVTVEADAAASGRITYSVGFYLVSPPPVDFSGFVPANADVRFNDFAVLLPSAGNHDLILKTTTGSYEFFVDGESKGEVTGTNDVTLDLTEGLHILSVSAEVSGAGEDVHWSVQILGQPKLEVRIVEACPTLNPESGQSVCVTGAEVSASDGKSPTVSYQWSASGGSFNSTTSQWVEWTAPPGVANFALTVEVSAPGYLSDTDSLGVQVVPEFSVVTLPFLLGVTAASLLLARRSTRHERYTQEPV